MINMAFMPLYMWEMWYVTPVTDRRTVESRAVFCLGRIKKKELKMGPIVNSILYNLDLEQLFVKMLSGRSIRKIWRMSNSRTHFTNKFSGMTIFKFLGTTICTQKRSHEWRFARFERKKLYATTIWKTLSETICKLCNRIWSTTEISQKDWSRS